LKGGFLKKKIYFDERPAKLEQPFNWNEVEWFLIARKDGKETRTSLTLDALTDKHKFDGIVSQVRQVIKNL